MESEPRWIAPGCMSRLYYLFVVPFFILASINTLILLLFGIETHYEVLYQVATFAAVFRESLYTLMFRVLNALPTSFLFAYAVVGSLPFRFKHWRFGRSPAGRYMKHRRINSQKKSDVTNVEPRQFTVE